MNYKQRTFDLLVEALWLYEGSMGIKRLNRVNKSQEKAGRRWYWDDDAKSNLKKAQYKTDKANSSKYHFNRQQSFEKSTTNIGIGFNAKSGAHSRRASQVAEGSLGQRKTDRIFKQAIKYRNRGDNVEAKYRYDFAKERNNKLALKTKVRPRDTRIPGLSDTPVSKKYKGK